MNLSVPIIAAYLIVIVLLVVLVVTYGMWAGVLGIVIVGLSFYVGAATEGNSK